MQDRIDYAKKHLHDSATLKVTTALECGEHIAEAALLIAMAFHGGNKLLLCGNGGSAGDCQHMASEFMGRLSKKITRKALPAIALTTDSSFLTAHANDVSFQDIFSRQVEGLGIKGDVLFAISTSGMSENVLWAVRKAQAMRLHIVSLTGMGGKLAAMASVAIRVPSKDTQLIQEAHLCIEHAICELVENELFVKELPGGEA